MHGLIDCYLSCSNTRDVVVKTIFFSRVEWKPIDVLGIFRFVNIYTIIKTVLESESLIRNTLAISAHYI